MKIFIAIIVLLILNGHRPKINYSVEIYTLKNLPANTPDKKPVEFAITKEELPETPFIRDDDIELFDTTSFEITFSKEAAEKIGKLSPELAVGIPFVLTVDREPVLTGYFVNIISSHGCAAYVLKNYKQTVQSLEKGLPDYSFKDLISEKRKNKNLIEALERTGRLK